MADQRIEQTRQEFEALNDKLHTRLAEENSTLIQLSSRQQDMEKQIELLNEEKRQQSRSLEDTRVALAKAESQRDEAIARSTELKETVTELKQENRDIRDHFEHYQQRTAEDRQQEREQFRIVNQGLNDQIQDLQHRLAQAESRASELFDATAQSQRNAAELKQATAALNSDLNTEIADNQTLEHEGEEAVTTGRERQHNNEHLAENTAALTTQNADADKQVAVLSHALEPTQAELKPAQEKVAFL